MNYYEQLYDINFLSCNSYLAEIKGKSILIVSFNLPEILGLSDRIIVMREGEIAGEIEKSDADESKILRMAYGLT